LPELTFLTNHTAVLALIAERPQITAREISSIMKITERAVWRLISELEAHGYICKEKVGRGTRYQVNPDLAIDQNKDQKITIGDLLRLLLIPCPLHPLMDID
jgi:DNA-binding transcriptional ArsR family regulator